MGRTPPPTPPRAGPAAAGAGHADDADGADDAGATVLHVDMDAFYASVEVRRRPDLRGRPVVVAGTGGRGVVTSASYEARAYGVRSAMPTSQARRRCPHAVVLPPDFPAYAEASRAVMDVFRSVTPLVEPISLDEAFLDVAGAVRRLGRPAAIAAAVRSRIAREQRLTCSVGVAPTKFVAKLASAHCKPDGLLVVPPGRVLDFLHPLPVAALWGVGDRTAEVLRRLGLRTVGELARTPERTLRDALGPALGAHLHALARGHDDRRVVPDEPDRSVGAEETFERDVGDVAALRRELLRLAERACARARSHGHAGRTVSVKVRYADFTTITRSRTLPAPTDVGQVVYAAARALFDALLPLPAPLRLLGVRLEGLVDAAATPEQLVLGARPAAWSEAQRAVDAAVRRFGADAVRPAALVDGPPDAGPP